MKMGKWNRVFIVSILFVVLVGCGKDTTTSTDTDTSVFTVSTTTSGTDTGSGSANNAPVITSLTASPATISVGETTTLTCLATDAENDPLTYYWEASSGTFSDSSVSGATISWTAPATAGSYIVSCRATDGKLETVVQVSVEVQAIVPTPTPTPANSAPVITSITATSAAVATNETISFSCIATDADNDSLTYTWSASSGTITGTDSTVSWTAPASVGSTTMNLSQSSSVGTATITCKASDGEAEASTQASVTVSAWIVPTQFESSNKNCLGVTDGTTYEGKLYLVWYTGNSGYCADPRNPKAYLSVFDSATADAIEVMRVEILYNGDLNYDSLWAVAVDQNGIYVAASYGGGGCSLLGLDFNAKQKWLVKFSDYGGADIFSIVAKNGYLYITGDVYGFLNVRGTEVIVGKYDTSGNLHWLSQWGTACFDRGWVIDVKDDGLEVFATAGETCGMFLDPRPATPPIPSYQGDVILKYDLNGNLLGVTK